MKYRFLENVAIADTCFEAFGKSESELFENSALAIAETMAEAKKVKPKEKREIALEAKSLEQLLHDFLDEIVFLKDESGMVFSKFVVKVSKEKNSCKVKAQIFGQKISGLGPKVLKTDVKAVTWHDFGIKKSGNNFVATVVLDV